MSSSSQRASPVHETRLAPLEVLIDGGTSQATMSMFPSAMKLMRGLYVNGMAVRAARKALGLTQEALALRAECDVKTIRNAEKSLRVDAATIKRVADSLEQPLTAMNSRLVCR